MEKTRQSYIYAGLAIFFWSTIPTAFKISLGELDILPMLTIAVLISTLVLFIIILAGKKADLIRKTTGKELLNSAILGFINPFVYYLILLKAYQLLPAQVAQPLNMIWPIILVFPFSSNSPAKNRKEKFHSSHYQLRRSLYYLFTG